MKVKLVKTRFKLMKIEKKTQEPLETSETISKNPVKFGKIKKKNIVKPRFTDENPAKLSTIKKPVRKTG